jgi:WD40 repeat protein
MYRRARASEARLNDLTQRFNLTQREAQEELRGRLVGQATSLARVPGAGLSALAPALRSLQLAQRDGVRPYAGARYALHRALVDVTRSLSLDHHRAPLTDFALSPDGHRVVTASLDRTARLWDLTTGVTVAVLDGHRTGVTAVRYTDDGARIVTTSADGRARVWDASTGASLNTPAPPAATPVVPAGAWSARAPTAVRASRDGRRVVVLAAGEATLWDADAAAPRATLTGHDGAITDIDLTDDGARALTTGADATARVWDFATGTSLQTLSGHRAEVLRGRFSRDGRAVITLGGDRAARVWPLGGTALVYALAHPAGAALRAARFSPDSQRLLTVSDPSVVWETDTGRLVATLSGAHVDDATFSSDGSLVLTRGADGVSVLRADGSGEVARIPGEARDAALSDDHQRVLTVGADRVVRLYHAAGGGLIAALGGAEGEVSGARFLGATGLVVVARTVGDPGLWRTSDGALERTLEGHRGVIRAVTATVDGRYLATLGDEGARLWNAASGLRFGSIDEHPGGVTKAYFSRDGATLVTVGAEGSARVWAVETVERLALIQPEDQHVIDARPNDEGDRVAVLTRWGVALLWNRRRGPLAQPFGENGRRIDAVAFAPDGRSLLTRSPDRAVRLFDAFTGQSIATLDPSPRPVTDARHSPDGRRLATVSADGMVRVWSVDEAEWVSLACAYLPGRRGWALDRPLNDYCATRRGAMGLRPVGP